MTVSPVYIDRRDAAEIINWLESRIEAMQRRIRELEEGNERLATENLWLQQKLDGLDHD